MAETPNEFNQKKDGIIYTHSYKKIDQSSCCRSKSSVCFLLQRSPNQDGFHKIRQRRLKANARERSRMHGLNTALDTLRQHIPAILATGCLNDSIKFFDKGEENKGWPKTYRRRTQEATYYFETMSDHFSGQSEIDSKYHRSSRDIEPEVPPGDSPTEPGNSSHKLSKIETLRLAKNYIELLNEIIHGNDSVLATRMASQLNCHFSRSVVNHLGITQSNFVTDPLASKTLTKPPPKIREGSNIVRQQVSHKNLWCSQFPWPTLKERDEEISGRERRKHQFSALPQNQQNLRHSNEEKRATVTYNFITNGSNSLNQNRHNLSPYFSNKTRNLVPFRESALWSEQACPSYSSTCPLEKASNTENITYPSYEARHNTNSFCNDSRDSTYQIRIKKLDITQNKAERQEHDIFHRLNEEPFSSLNSETSSSFTLIEKDHHVHHRQQNKEGEPPETSAIPFRELANCTKSNDFQAPTDDSELCSLANAKASNNSYLSSITVGYNSDASYFYQNQPCFDDKTRFHKYVYNRPFSDVNMQATSLTDTESPANSLLPYQCSPNFPLTYSSSTVHSLINAHTYTNHYA